MKAQILTMLEAGDQLDNMTGALLVRSAIDSLPNQEAKDQYARIFFDRAEQALLDASPVLELVALYIASQCPAVKAKPIVPWKEIVLCQTWTRSSLIGSDPTWQVTQRFTAPTRGPAPRKRVKVASGG